MHAQSGATLPRCALYGAAPRTPTNAALFSNNFRFDAAVDHRPLDLPKSSQPPVRMGLMHADLRRSLFGLPRKDCRRDSFIPDLSAAWLYDILKVT
jgi:hypothetical protein